MNPQHAVEPERILLASDHAGLAAKRTVVDLLAGRGVGFEDLGTFDEGGVAVAVDYPDFARKVAQLVSWGQCHRGILICGSGIGMSIVANRFPGVRAALCHSEEEARLSRQHNDANVLVLGGRLLDPADLAGIVCAWLETPFEQGHHAGRVAKIDPGRPPQGGPHRLTVFDHPLVQHKLTVIRDKNCDTKLFREVVDELSMLMAYEITRDIAADSKTVETPMGVTATGWFVRGDRVGVVPILRAGLGMIHGILTAIPMAAVGHIGIYRNHETLKPVDYYCKLPLRCEDRTIIVVDPMLATGGSAVAAIDYIKGRGARRIKFNCILAAPEGLARLSTTHPDVEIFTAGVDERLNENGYILPGLGDAGDRLFGTE